MKLLQCQGTQYVTDQLAHPDFKNLLNRIAGAFPSKAALAKAVGVTPSRLTRAINTGDFPFNVANCLRLAKLSGESPTEILRAAGKTDVAELIESLYGREAEYTVDEREILTTWRGLTPRAKGALRTLLEDLAPQKARLKQKRSA